MHRQAYSSVLVLALVLSGSTSHAQDGKGPASQLVIRAASADAASVEIAGVNFGSNPVVFLGGLPLAGVHVNAALYRDHGDQSGISPGHVFTARVERQRHARQRHVQPDDWRGRRRWCNGRDGSCRYERRGRSVGRRRSTGCRWRAGCNGCDRAARYPGRGRCARCDRTARSDWSSGPSERVGVPGEPDAQVGRRRVRVRRHSAHEFLGGIPGSPRQHRDD